MASAQSFQCPSCGAAVSERARKCEYCRAPVATVRCAGCFAMNIVDAHHCRGCGRELGLEPVTTSGSLPCPRCRMSLGGFRSGSGTIHDCGECGGQFVDHALLKELLEHREAARTTIPRRYTPHNPLNEPLRYLKCPECEHLMHRRNFGRSSGVIVDICARHGVWFDCDELPRVLAFVQAGGLVEARRREIEQLERAAQERRELRGLDSSAPRLGGDLDTSLLGDLADAATQLLELVRNRLRSR